MKEEEERGDKCSDCEDRESCELRASEQFFRAHEKDFEELFEDIRPAMSEIVNIVLDYYTGLSKQVIIEHLTIHRCCLSSALGSAFKLGYYKGRNRAEVPEVFIKEFKKEEK